MTSVGGGELVQVQPTELKFPFELKKQSSCPMHLTNKTDQYLAFKVKTTNPRKYAVRPNTGIIAPNSNSDVTVIMQAQKEGPVDLQCTDKFLVQCAVTNQGAILKDITSDTFKKAPGKVVDEVKLRVIYIPTNPPSPVPEELEEGLSPRSSIAENGNSSAVLFDADSRHMDDPSRERSPEDSSMISKLVEEKNSAIQINKKLNQELELLRKERSKTKSGGFSFMFVFLLCLIAIVFGYVMRNMEISEIPSQVKKFVPGYN